MSPADLARVDLPNASTESELAGAVESAVAQSSARFVAFAAPAATGVPSAETLTKHAERLAERCAVGDLPFPLLTLTGSADHAVLTTYRDWVTRHHALPSEQVEALDAYLSLLPLRNVGASIHGLDVLDSGTTVRLTGTCRRGGADGPAPEHLTVSLLLAGRDGTVRLAVPTSPRLRFEGGAERWTGFVADLPVSDLPDGSSLVHLEITVPGHPPVRRPAAAAVGMVVTSRPIVTAGRRLQALPADGQDRVELLVRPASRPLSRVRWSAAMLRRDLPQLLRGRELTWVRPVRALTRPWRRQPIWLIGERPDTARDNGYHLFAHLRRERPDIRAHYVIDRGSDQYPTVAGLGGVVAHSSWRHRWLMLHASVLANAYSFKHMVPSQWDPRAYMRQVTWRVGAYRVYLKHGINLNTKELRRRTGGYDLYLTASEAESVAARRTSGYDRQIVQTGLPRFDALVPTPPSRMILFMPTWRLYLVPPLFGQSRDGEIPFEGSAYQRFVEGLLRSPRLHALLELHDYRLQLMPHYNLRAHLADIDAGSERISVLDGASADIQDVMRTCDVFVTDHSSVHFDLAYLGTPVVYAHFDAEEYATGHARPSWFDHERDGFGPVRYDLDTTLDAIEHYVANGCVREPVYTERARHAFTFHDRDSSRRAVAAIEDLVR